MTRFTFGSHSHARVARLSVSRFWLVTWVLEDRYLETGHGNLWGPPTPNATVLPSNSRLYDRGLLGDNDG